MLSSIPIGKIVTVTAPSAVAPTSTSASSATGKGTGKANVGVPVIVGSTIGACVLLSLLTFLSFLAWRKRSARRDATTPNIRIPTSTGTSASEVSGFSEPAAYVEAGGAGKMWQGQEDGRRGEGDDVPKYPGVRWGVVEVDGRERAVEVPG